MTSIEAGLIVGTSMTFLLCFMILLKEVFRK